MAIHLLASLDNALIMETYPGVKSQYNPVLPLYPVKNGHVTVPETPGLGIDPDPELLERYQIGN
jgi:L-alanine-DL-glutamate epimerase-like enolase superfamily enzyme